MPSVVDLVAVGTMLYAREGVGPPTAMTPAARLEQLASRALLCPSTVAPTAVWLSALFPLPP